MEIEEIAVSTNILVIALKGSLTARQVEEAKKVFESVAARGIHYIIADLSEVPFMDSTGLMAIISGHKRLKEQGAALKLVAPVPQVRLLLDLTMVDKLISIYYDRDEAINSVPRP
jgi:anti-sigma B factor antagonist